MSTIRCRVCLIDVSGWEKHRLFKAKTPDAALKKAQMLAAVHELEVHSISAINQDSVEVLVFRFDAGLMSDRWPADVELVSLESLPRLC